MSTGSESAQEADNRVLREIVLIRHAQTEWSLSGRHTGRTDIPLTEQGRAHARTLAEPLRAWRFQLVLVSPSTRARETCELCGLHEGAQVREDLHEWDYGEYEGLTTQQIHVERPSWVLWRDGCPGGEGAIDVGARADRVIAELNAVPLAHRGRCEGNVAVFSHGHMLRVLGARWIGLAAHEGARLALSTGTVSVLAREHQTPVIARWNDATL